MRGVVMHAPGDVDAEEGEKPQLRQPTDALMQLLERAAEAYQAMDERRAIKVLLRP